MRISFLLLILSMCILPLFGCSVNTELCKQCVTDTIDNPKNPGMYIESQIPQGAALSLSRDDGRYAVFTHPDYEITQEIFASDSWDNAFRHVSGRSTEDLGKILVGSFPHEKYRCTWAVAGETGTDLCQSVIFYDGSFYYAVSIQCSEEKAQEYAQDFSDLLSCVSLQIVSSF